jgi:hypothetical protein
MEIGSTELFIEILVAGTIFAFGVSPLLIWATPSLRTAPGLLPGFQSWAALKPSLLVVVAFVYALGVGGNRLLEVAYHYLPAGSYDFGLVCNEVKLPACEDKLKELTAGISDKRLAVREAYEKAEIVVRAKDDFSQDWVERHKSYRKIMRASAAAALVFVVCAFLYLLLTRCECNQHATDDKKMLARYCGRHFLAAAAVLAFSVLAFWLEDKHYKADLMRYYVVLADMTSGSGH